jgi:hypothetical protein
MTGDKEKRHDSREGRNETCDKMQDKRYDLRDMRQM